MRTWGRWRTHRTLLGGLTQAFGIFDAMPPTPPSIYPLCRRLARPTSPLLDDQAATLAPACTHWPAVLHHMPAACASRPSRPSQRMTCMPLWSRSRTCIPTSAPPTVNGHGSALCERRPQSNQRAGTLSKSPQSSVLAASYAASRAVRCAASDPAVRKLLRTRR